MSIISIINVIIATTNTKNLTHIIIGNHNNDDYINNVMSIVTMKMVMPLRFMIIQFNHMFDNWI